MQMKSDTDNTAIVWFRRVLFAFILMQPVIDIFTALCVRLNWYVSFGVIIRSAFLAALCIYVFFFSNGKTRKFLAAYLVILGIYAMLFFFQIYRIAGFSTVLANVKDFVKTFSYPVYFAGFFAIYKKLGITIPGWILSVIVTVFTGSIFAAILTGTSQNSYSTDDGFGFIGWFYAANEIGAAITILAPVAILSSVTTIAARLTKKWLKLVIIFLELFLVALMASFIGTKAVFASIIAYVACFILWNAIFWIRDHSAVMRRSASFAVLYVLIICAIFSVSPLYSNITGTLKTSYDKMIQQTKKEEAETDEEGETLENEETMSEEKKANLRRDEDELKKSKIYKFLDVFLSNRLSLASNVHMSYVRSSLPTKLLGLGYVNTDAYEYRISKSVEMDFLSVFYRHGAVGLVIFSAPALYGIYISLRYIITHIKASFRSITFCTYFFSFVLGLGIAFFTGHTLVAPAVSIYVAIIEIKLIEAVDKSKKDNNNVSIQ